MARKIVHDEDVAGVQFEHQHRHYIYFKPITIDRSVQPYRRDHSCPALASHQRRRFVMTMREAKAQPLAFGATTMAAGHVGYSPLKEPDLSMLAPFTSKDRE